MPDQNSPEPIVRYVQDDDEEYIVVLNPDGTRQVISFNQERVLINQATGDRRVTRTRTYLRTEDGRLIQNPDGEPLYNCGRCPRQLLDKHSIHFCNACQEIICLTCTVTLVGPDGQPLYLCSQCGAAEERRRRRSFFWRIR